MRIVLDTNVLARAAMRTFGLGRELLLRCTENPHVLVLSEFIISEVSRVLRYARMRKAHGQSDQDIEEYIGRVERLALVPIAGLVLVRPVVRLYLSAVKNPRPH